MSSRLWIGTISNTRRSETSPLLNGLLAYWNLNDNGSGAVSLVDSSGNNRTLVKENNVPLGSGKIGGSAGFANSDDGGGGILIAALRTTSSFTPTGNNPFSFSSWIKLSPSFTFMAFSWGIADTAQAVALYVPEPLRLNFQFWDAGFGDIPVTADQWIHVVGTYNGTTAKIYVNGSLADSLVISLDTGSGVFRFHEWVNGSTSDPYADGIEVDELGVWNRSLSDNEILALYNAGAGLTYPFTN